MRLRVRSGSGSIRQGGPYLALLTPALREDQYVVPGLLQSAEGRSEGALNLQVASDPWHAKGGATAS